MKLIITESKRNDVVTKWLDNNYTNLKKSYGYGMYTHLFYEDDNDDDILYYDYNRDLLQIWDKSMVRDLINLFGVEENQLDNIFRPWFEKTYGILPMSVKYRVFRFN